MSLKLESKKLHQQVSCKLLHLRNARGISMRSLAEQIDCPHSFIGKIEKQQRRVDVGEFIHYCRAMKYDPAKVLQQVLIDSANTQNKK